ncbi:MAG: tRNA (N6-isopentenyl adenosine(37)-C2)-methylthiotransferase MiaB [Clostridiales bacterium]|jgi:tRNA-2-methylthio-N6-dimethylallyladenosine synthase|nr:tRNA (N6-isopentenyl adenosine(37)-C2)-methylthiotransferase MiaB [Clostridiales bacterium]
MKKQAPMGIDDYIKQKYYIDIFREINKIDPKKFYIGTYGCQMNVRDSETLHGILSDMGFVESKEENDADLIVYNTCCVRENAENKVFGNLGILKNLKKYKPGLKIILCGCMMQQDTIIEKIKNTYKHVDVIFGTFNIQRLPELLNSNYETGEIIIDVWDTHTDIVEGLPVIREKPFRASVNIMYGCDNFCTYCIVPYVRGRERSREPKDIICEIENLVGDGVKEILLLGQNVNSYGKSLPEPKTFAELLNDINNIKGLERIRFITSHPKDLSDELILAMKNLNKVCAHLHLPFQSGSDNILKKMNRGYTKSHYLNLVEKVRSAVPDIGISTDIIVGFPGESEEDFLDTLDVVE